MSYLSIKFPRYDGSSSDQFCRSLIAFRLSQLLIKRLAVAMLNRLLFSQWNSSKFSKLFINKIFLIESSFTAVRPPKSIFLRVEPEHWAIFYVKYKAILFKKSIKLKLINILILIIYITWLPKTNVTKNLLAWHKIEMVWRLWKGATISWAVLAIATKSWRLQKIWYA